MTPYTQTPPMELNKNQLSIILDGLKFFDGDNDGYISYNGEYQLTKYEIDELLSMIEKELNI